MDTLNRDAALIYLNTLPTEADIQDELYALRQALSDASQTKEQLLGLARTIASQGIIDMHTFQTSLDTDAGKSPDTVIESAEVPPNATAEYVLAPVYDRQNEILIDGAEILLQTLNENLEHFSLTPHERENIKLGLLGYVFDHYYDVLGGIKIADLQSILGDLTGTFQSLTGSKPSTESGEPTSIMEKFHSFSELMSGGAGSFQKVEGLINPDKKLSETIQTNLLDKFGPIIELLTQYRSDKSQPPGPDVLTGFLSDPENILNFDTRFSAKTAEELESRITGIPPSSPESTALLAGKLRTVFDGKIGILDQVTGQGKDILDMFADSPDTQGPMSWGRDIIKEVLKFLSSLPFVGGFVRGMLGIEGEDVEEYFGDKKRFQRLSAKNLKGMSEKPGSILSGKNLINVTMRRIAPFTQAYFSALSETDAEKEKIQSISPKMWTSIIDKHQIILRDTMLNITDEKLHIGDADFDTTGKPLTTFFDKINGLVTLIAEDTPVDIPPPSDSSAPLKGAPPSTPAGSPAVTASSETPTSATPSSPSSGDAPVAIPPSAPVPNPEVATPNPTISAAPQGSPEVKTKAQYGEEIIAICSTQIEILGGSIDTISPDLKPVAQGIFNKLSEIIADTHTPPDKKIPKIQGVLLFMNSFSSKMGPEQKQQITDMLTLIEKWEKAPS